MYVSICDVCEYQPPKLHLILCSSSFIHITNDAIEHIFHACCWFEFFITLFVNEILDEIHHVYNFFVEIQIEYFNELVENVKCTNSIKIIRHLERQRNSMQNLTTCHVLWYVHRLGVFQLQYNIEEFYLWFHHKQLCMDTCSPSP